jgi:hypothetical protein
MDQAKVIDAMKGKTFILTEAAAMVPLVRRILRDIRASRARLSRIQRRLAQGRLTKAERDPLARESQDLRRNLAACLAEAESLGVEITPGVRCEALFPFEHQWIGPRGDGKLRPAYFVYSDAEPTIRKWFFSGWPRDRRVCSSHWWQTYRPGVARKARSLQPA